MRAYIEKGIRHVRAYIEKGIRHVDKGIRVLLPGGQGKGGEGWREREREKYTLDLPLLHDININII